MASRVLALDPPVDGPPRREEGDVQLRIEAGIVAAFTARSSRAHGSRGYASELRASNAAPASAPDAGRVRTSPPSAARGRPRGSPSAGLSPGPGPGRWSIIASSCTVTGSGRASVSAPQRGRHEHREAAGERIHQLIEPDEGSAAPHSAAGGRRAARTRCLPRAPSARPPARGSRRRSRGGRTAGRRRPRRRPQTRAGGPAADEFAQVEGRARAVGEHRSVAASLDHRVPTGANALRLIYTRESYQLEEALAPVGTGTRVPTGANALRLINQTARTIVVLRKNDSRVIFLKLR